MTSWHAQDDDKVEVLYINVKRIPKGQLIMENPEKLAAQFTQDEEKQNKNTTHYVLDTAIRKQTQIT